MADDVAEPIRRLGLGRAAVMGFSLGGGVGLRTAIRHPDLVERLPPGRARVEDWPVLVRQVSEIAKLDYDWSAEIPGLRMPVVLVAGDADGLPPSTPSSFSASSAAAGATPTGTAPA